MIMNKIKYLSIFAAASLLGFSACIDADIDDAVDYEDTYTDISDADKHILGVYSEFMDLAEQMVVLGEVRADLMTITDNSNDYLQQVDANVYDANNPYMDPTAYYKVINECNDVLVNFDRMHAKHSLEDDEYAERYSDIQAIRCYTYLQLATQFSPVWYLTEPVVSVDDMKNIQAKGQTVTIGDLIPRLIGCMEACPTLKDYEESPLVTNNGSAVSLDGELMKFYFINKKLLLADLYLWNNQFREAATLYKEFMDTDSKLDDTNNYERFKCSTSLDESVSASYYQASLSRYKYWDVNSYNSNWMSMFSDAATTNYTRAAFSQEWIWTITFTQGREPAYPFVKLFASVADGGSYQLRPSSDCLYRFNRTDRLRTNGAPYDTRGDSATYEVRPSGDTVCAKYLYFYEPSKPYQQEGRWWLYRTAKVHLRFAECMNRLGYPQFALNFAQSGIQGTYGNSYPSSDLDGRSTDSLSNIRNYSTPNLFQVMYPISSGVCDNEADSALLFFDARMYTTAAQNPYEKVVRRGPWRQSRGVRRRSCMADCQVADHSTTGSLANCTTKEDSIYLVEKILLDEAANELAHEGNRWEDLVRVARRMNTSTTTSTVNGTVYTLTNDGMSGDTWFREIMADKAAGSRNTLGIPSYGAESSWYYPGK